MKKIDINRLKDDYSVKLRNGTLAKIDSFTYQLGEFSFRGHTLYYPIYGIIHHEVKWSISGKSYDNFGDSFDIVSGHCFVEDDGKVSDKVKNAMVEVYEGTDLFRDMFVNRSNSDSEIPDGFLPFDVEKAKDGWPVVTREGCKVNILKTDLRGKFPIAAVIKRDDEDSIDSFTEGGTYYGDGSICCDDLFLKQNSVFANVYDREGIITVGKCYTTDDEAKSEHAAKKSTYVKTIEITIG